MNTTIPCLKDRRPTLLLVDDEPMNLHVLRNLLQDDYHLLFARDGTKALALAQRHRPDLVLLDVMMPGMSGHEVCKQFKADRATARIPVIFVTALTAAGDEEVGFDLGAVDYITKPVSPSVVKARVRTHLSLVRIDELRESRLQVVQRLGRAAEYRDNETGMHVLRLSHYAQILALAVGFNEKDADDLLNATPMHDVGKIGIPDHILQKPHGLTEAEWTVMRTHTTIGADIIGVHEGGMLAMARHIALSHHERWDGTGYPHGLAGTAIPIEARIVALADVFDALTSVQPYKGAWSVEDTVAQLRRESGWHFDPDLVEPFVNVLPALLQIRARYADHPAVAEAAESTEMLLAA
jgi:putative two-component system response regulator